MKWSFILKKNYHRQILPGVSASGESQGVGVDTHCFPHCLSSRCLSAGGQLPNHSEDSVKGRLSVRRHFTGARGDTLFVLDLFSKGCFTLASQLTFVGVGIQSIDVLTALAKLMPT